MSIAVMSRAWLTDTQAVDKIVLLALADRADDEGHCWPGIASLSKKCGLSERSVQRSIQSLVEAGHLTRKDVPGKGCNYTVHPRHAVTPDTLSPPTESHVTPDTQSPNTSGNINNDKAIALSRPTGPKSTYPPSFEKLWSAYPRHQGKGAAHKAWIKAGKCCGGGLGARDKLQAAVEAYAAHLIAHPPDDPQFIPMLATWLNQSRYDDPIEELGNERSNPASNLQPRNSPRPHSDRLAAGLRILADYA